MSRVWQRIRSTIGAAALAVSLTQCWPTEGINDPEAVEVFGARVLNLQPGAGGVMLLRGSGGLSLPVEVVFEHRTERGDSASAWVPQGNAAVTWRTSGQVTLGSSETVTSADGHARATIMLGLEPNLPGGVGATIRFGGSVASTDASVEVILPEIDVVSGDGQSGIGATALAEPLVVQLLSHPSLGQRRPVPNVVIHFTPLDNDRNKNGFAEPATVTTGADGRAASQWVLGYGGGALGDGVASPQQQIARPRFVDGILNLGFIRFSAAVAAPRFDIQIVAGNAQTGTPGQPLRESLVATVTATNVATSAVLPARGVEVTWSPSTGGSVSLNSSVTDAQGRVSTAWTLGPQLGPQTTGATVSSTVSATFTATAVGGRALRVVSGDRQLDLPGATLQPIIVEYVEFAANSGTPIPIPNATITSTVSSGGGLVTPSSGTTNAQGRVTIGWTLGPAAGDQIIRVATPPIPNADPASIFALDIHATAALRYVLRSVSGNNQSGPVSALLVSPLEVELVAINPATGTTTPVANQFVNWSVLSGGGTVVQAIARTNAQGRNTAEWTLGASLGVQGARASVLPSILSPGSVLEADFSATAGAPPRLAYARLDQSSIDAGRADAAYAFNAAGGDITVQTVGTGRYDVTFPNLRTPASSSTTVLVTAYGRTTAWCKTASWRNGVNNSLVASVACFDQTTPASSEFTTLVLGRNALPGRFAFAHASQPGASAYTPPDSASFNSTNQTITAVRDGEGTYRVVFPGLTRPATMPMDGVLATAVGPGTARCAIATDVDPLNGVSVPAVCVDPAGEGGYGGYGARTDATFVVTTLDKGRPGMRWGYAYTGDTYSAPGSTPITKSLTSTGSLVRQLRLGTGRYELTFPGLARPAGATEGVQVTAASENGDYCKVLGWESVGQDLAVQVQCYESDDLTVDDQDFTIVVIQ